MTKIQSFGGATNHGSKFYENSQTKRPFL